MTVRRLALVVGGSLALAQEALAHGIHKALLPPDTSLTEFGRLGALHMLGGYDHLLFVLGIAVLFVRPWDVLKAVTLFTVGHSLTLVAATLLGLRVSPTLVDALIALSVVYIGLEIAVSRGEREDIWRARWVILGFGLIHGLGLSTRLQALGLPDDSLLPRVLSFNLGVELGQLLALCGFLGLVWVLRWRGWLERLQPRIAGALQLAGAFLCLYLVMLFVGGVPPA